MLSAPVEGLNLGNLEDPAQPGEGRKGILVVQVRHHPLPTATFVAFFAYRIVHYRAERESADLLNPCRRIPEANGPATRAAGRMTEAGALTVFEYLGANVCIRSGNVELTAPDNERPHHGLESDRWTKGHCRTRVLSRPGAGGGPFLRLRTNQCRPGERVRDLDVGGATHRCSGRGRQIRPRCQPRQPDHRSCTGTPGPPVGAARRCVSRTHRRQLGHRGAVARSLRLLRGRPTLLSGQGRQTDRPLRVRKGAQVGCARRERQRSAIRL